MSDAAETDAGDDDPDLLGTIRKRVRRDPHGVAREFQLALERSTSTMMAQSGQV